MKKQFISVLLLMSICHPVFGMRKYVERKKSNVSTSVERLKTQGKEYKQYMETMRQERNENDQMQRCMNINGKELLTTLAGVAALGISVAQFIISIFK